MNSHMIVATFKPGTDMAEVLQVVREEQVRVEELRAEGKLTAVHLATVARQTVFLEVNASNPHEAEAIVRSLPMAKWWDVDVYPLNAAASTAS